METSEFVTLPISPQTFWGLIILAAVLGATVATYQLLKFVRQGEGETATARLKARLGLTDLPDLLFEGAILIWGLIFAVLTAGLLWTILGAAFHAPALDADLWTLLRSKLITLAALTATMGAVVALPFTLIRLTLTRKQADTSAEALFNDKINAAAEGLAARRQVTRVIHQSTAEEAVLTEWQDDLVTRASAIDRLEGLANERPEEAGRIARMLSIYVRELSREFRAIVPPAGASPDDLSDWARGLQVVRPDMEKAAQSLGRLQEIDGHTIRPDSDIDLEGANLQGFRLTGLQFDNAVFSAAKMQGAYLDGAELQGAYLDGAELQGAYLDGAVLQAATLSGAKMQGAYLDGAELQAAYLNWAEMQGADLSGAEMQGADLRGAEMQGADLRGAEMQGADLSGAEMDDITELTRATLRSALVSSVDDKTIAQLQSFIDQGDLFHGDAVELNELVAQWHAWQETLPDFDPSWRFEYWQDQTS